MATDTGKDIEYIKITERYHLKSIRMAIVQETRNHEGCSR